MKIHLLNNRFKLLKSSNIAPITAVKVAMVTKPAQNIITTPIAMNKAKTMKPKISNNINLIFNENNK